MIKEQADKVFNFFINKMKMNLQIYFFQILRNKRQLKMFHKKKMKFFQIIGMDFSLGILLERVSFHRKHGKDAGRGRFRWNPFVILAL